RSAAWCRVTPPGVPPAGPPRLPAHSPACLLQVVFGKKLPAFATIPIQQLQHEKKYDIYFADGKVFALYRQLLLHQCPCCPELPPFGLFTDLEQHMRRQHELFCCKLCLKHLKIFTYERKWYSRKDLARHRMQGDPDDTSHRGHPLCKFCDERYLDNDELLKHLRRDHYFCHFCDATPPREEEDREVAAAIRASVAAQQQPEPRRSEDREEGGRPKKVDAAGRGPEESRGPRRTPRTQAEGSGPQEASANGPASQEAFPAGGSPAGPPLPRCVSAGPGEGVGPHRPLTGIPVLPSAPPPPAAKLKDEDFPSLCAASASGSVVAPGPMGLALAYPGPARGRSAFQEEDFPALVSSAPAPGPAPPSLISPWNSSGSKKAAPPGVGAQAARKPGKAGRGGRKAGPPPAEDEEPRGGLAAGTAATQPFTKVGKKKKVGSEKPSAASPPPPPDRDGPPRTPAAPAGRPEGPVAAIVNGHTEGPAPARSTPKEPPGLPRPPGPLPCPPPQEDFPALSGSCPPRMPPPPGTCPVHCSGHRPSPGSSRSSRAGSATPPEPLPPPGLPGSREVLGGPVRAPRPAGLPGAAGKPGRPAAACPGGLPLSSLWRRRGGEGWVPGPVCASGRGFSGLDRARLRPRASTAAPGWTPSIHWCWSQTLSVSCKQLAIS
ncbi:PREDICTED: zinc finger protein 598, partial [Condylura cristata]|uniref:zinc finger protein 598 n=1 Tax=Condylura cristata TaxID=143302 RepID=UPI0006436685